MVLKLMSHLMYRYDYKISPRCFSFRRDSSAKEAITQILKMKNLDGKYCLKIDISNYFNSIPVKGLTEVLEQIIDDDKMLLQFLVRLLSDGRAYEDGKLICEREGQWPEFRLHRFCQYIFVVYGQ